MAPDDLLACLAKLLSRSQKSVDKAKAGRKTLLLPIYFNADIKAVD